MSSVELAGVTVSHDGRCVLDHVELTVADGERVAVLGPSGSGKTTLLRVIAGLQPLDAGVIRLDAADVTRTPPRDRDIGMVTQQGSLQPHLDVAENLGFALRLRKVARSEIAERVDAEARAFSLRDLLRRRPRTLSAGERHEVELARSLVRRVSVLLVDEPFAQIDPLRRAALLRELIDVQEGYGATMVVATNDQRIATDVAHRMVVLDDGRVMQIGTPDELYRRPASTFVAGFLGELPMNLLPGELRRDGGATRVIAGDLEIPSWDLSLTRHPGQPVVVGIRPTDLHLTDGGGPARIRGIVRGRGFLGHAITLEVESAAGMLLATVPRPEEQIGDHVELSVKPSEVHVFAIGGEALAHGV